MGGTTFMTLGHGKTAQEAFERARSDAQYEHGHGGYTGTIAEKDRITMITVPAEKNPRVYARDLLEEDDPRVNDKWGPAGCVKAGDGEWLFFGWASC